MKRLFFRVCGHFIGMFIVYFMFSYWFWSSVRINSDAMLILHILALFIAAMTAGLGTYFDDKGLKEISAKVRRFGYLLAVIVFVVVCFWVWLVAPR